MQMPPRISPLSFYRAFQEVTTKEAAQLAEIWSSWVAFTRVMREDIFSRVSSVLKVEYYPRDYYTLDGVFYNEKDPRFAEHLTYAYSIAVALEHENNPAGTKIEMNKLQLFNTPLKVLVTYPNPSYTEEHLLPQYSDAIASADLFDDFSTLRRQLVIFGSKESNLPEWKGFVYSHERFIPVENSDEDSAP